MNKIDRILQQRLEASQRIKTNYPDQCAEYINRCHCCRYWLNNKQDCVHGLAPVTSALLPCPYYMLYTLNDAL